jgi:glycosyltransferase involved in cell wall biosynthesis
VQTAVSIYPPTWELPEFETHSYRANEHRYCLLIPVINEGKKFLAQLEKLQQANFPIDIVICDGGSTDGSTASLAKLGVNTLLVKTGKGKLSAQLRMGFAFALARNYEGVVAIDGNGKDGIEAIPRFIKELEQGVDFIQGSRFVKGGQAINTPIDRLLALRLLHAPMISLAAKFWYTDTTNGFKAYSARFLGDRRVAPFRAVFDTYNLHYYLSVRAGQLGFSVKEIPVTRQYPKGCAVPTKIGGFSAKMHIIKLLFESCIGKYDPQV